MELLYFLVFLVFLDALIVQHVSSFHDDPFQPNSVHADSSLFTSEEHVAYDNLTLPGRGLESDTPIILWWTGRLFTQNNPQLIKCNLGSCLTLKDRSKFTDPRTRGLLFYGTDFNVEDLPLPRLKHHEWALIHEESPMNNYIFSHGSMMRLFNHTATFRHESDYPLTSQYINSINYLTGRKPVSLDKKNSFRKEGFAPVVYVQSHCDVASDRDRYVEELIKYIKIDSYGKCVNNKNLPNSLKDPVSSMESEEFLNLISNYKFHLSFENALCKDYMTEKLFRTLHVGSVPIYRGSPDARKWAPGDKSIIMTDDFSSVKDLAEFISVLDKNDEEYEKHLLYKTHGVTNSFLIEHLKTRAWGNDDSYKGHYIEHFQCFFCDRILERLFVEKQQKLNPSVPLLPPKTANSSHMGCPQPHASVGFAEDLPKSDSWKKMNWIEDYWSGMDKARAINKMIQNGEADPSTFHKYWTDIVRNIESTRHP